jgi:transketolase
MGEVRLESIARECRVQILRMLAHAGSGHPGGSLSVIDILTTLYFGRLRFDPKRPDWPDRDRVVLSKGHAVPALYAVLSRAGYFPEKQLLTLRKLGSPLQGHPDRTALPGIEAATGSLGEGLSISLGMALGLKLAGSKARVYCILGDGETQEGQIWEAAMSAPKLGQPDHALDNLVVILDYNRIQLDNFVKKVLDIEPVTAKWQAFGWPGHRDRRPRPRADHEGARSGGGDPRRADVHRGAHGEGQGRVVHGERSGVARQGARSRRRRSRPFARSSGSAKAPGRTT